MRHEATGRRKIFCFALCALLLALELSAEAQQPKKIPRIGLMTATGDAKTPGPQVEAFQQGLKELGFIEGKNCVVEYRFETYGEGHRELVAELLQLKVAVLVVGSLPAIRAAKAATKTVPIVIVTVQDPIASGYIDSLAHPGGNITGLTVIAEQLSGKRLELLKEINPKITRVAVFRSPTTPIHAVLWKETQEAATTLGIKVFPLDIQGPEDIESGFATMAREHASAFIVLPEPISFTNRKKIVDLAAKQRLPAMYPWNEFAESGGLIVYGPNRDDVWRRSATYVDKILKGANPADLPVEQPTKFELVINLKTAKQIGLTIPPNVLARADKVIK